MSKNKTTEDARVPYGWCITKEHDTPQGRGPCPVQVGAQKPCSCECHGGAVEPRGLLGAAERSPGKPEPTVEEVRAEAPEEGSLPVVSEGAQIPLL